MSCYYFLEKDEEARDRDQMRYDRHKDRQRDRNIARAAPDKRYLLIHSFLIDLFIQIRYELIVILFLDLNYNVTVNEIFLNKSLLVRPPNRITAKSSLISVFSTRPKGWIAATETTKHILSMINRGVIRNRLAPIFIALAKMSIKKYMEMIWNH